MILYFHTYTEIHVFQGLPFSIYLQGLQNAGITVYKGQRLEIDRHTSQVLLQILKQLPERNNEISTFPSTSSDLQIHEELNDTEGVSIVPFEITKGGSLNRRRLIIPRSPSPHIGDKISSKFRSDKRKCKLHLQSVDSNTSYDGKNIYQ